MSTECPHCGSRYLRPARTRSLSERLAKLRFVSPLRCLDCKKRFVGRTFILRDLFYARCPTCLRMDLNCWTGKTFTDPPFWVAVKVAFGAHKWRCEYCRFNFASFRRRKEVFTFKRWQKKVRACAVPPGSSIRGERQRTLGERKRRKGRERMSRVRGTIERTTGMLGVRSAAECAGFPVCRSPASVFLARRVGATNVSSTDLHPAGAGNSERPFARP